MVLVVLSLGHMLPRELQCGLTWSAVSTELRSSHRVRPVSTEFSIIDQWSAVSIELGSAHRRSVCLDRVQHEGPVLSCLDRARIPLCLGCAGSISAAPDSGGTSASTVVGLSHLVARLPASVALQISWHMMSGTGKRPKRVPASHHQPTTPPQNHQHTQATTHASHSVSAEVCQHTCSSLPSLDLQCHSVARVGWSARPTNHGHTRTVSRSRDHAPRLLRVM